MIVKPRSSKICSASLPSDWHPLLRTIYANRLDDCREIDKSLRALLPFAKLQDVTVAAKRLAVAIEKGERIVIYGDYDCDGATATALMVRVLKKLHANVSWFIPNRRKDGYGLTSRGLQQITADVIVTVDNGISSLQAAREAQQRGISLIISDHHEPAATLPLAVAVVNPKRRDDRFESKALSGVGVAFYLLLALRAELDAQGKWNADLRLRDYLDLVAVGTIADLVKIDHNNRILVHAGLQTLRRTNNANNGLLALATVADVPCNTFSSSDISFAIAPRINSLGRLRDMNDGVELLLCDDLASAQEWAQRCDDCNRERKSIENKILDEALAKIDSNQALLFAHAPQWHEGVLGIVAGRLKAHFNKPVMIATDSVCGKFVKASLRSVQGIDIHEFLEKITLDIPKDAIQFGGHAMAGGLTVCKQYWNTLLTAAIINSNNFNENESVLLIDGELPAELFKVKWANYLQLLEPWGEGFSQPLFCNVFEVISSHKLGNKHCKFLLRESHSKLKLNACWFFKQCHFNSGTMLEVVFYLQVNRFYGDERLDIIICNAQQIAKSNN